MMSLELIRLHCCRVTIAVSAAMAFSFCAHAQSSIPGYPEDVRAYDKREVGMLPRYCIHTQNFRERVEGGNNPEQIKYWRSVMGERFEAMHHYCWALMKTYRGNFLARTSTQRYGYLRDAISDYEYVIRGSPRDFFLLPEILTKNGDNYVRLGEAAQGIRNYQLAIEIKPDYWPPYAAISDYFKKLGDIKKARDVLEKGLSMSPDVKALTTRLKELDGVKSKTNAAVTPPAKPAVTPSLDEKQP
jgi:tetratricopeptide (TPR) repeat protein